MPEPRQSRNPRPDPLHRLDLNPLQLNNAIMTSKIDISAAIEAFAADVTAKTKAGGAPEDQLRAPFEALMKAVGAAMGKDVVCTGETPLPSLQGRPDYGVTVGGLLAGHVELKAPGKGVQPQNFTGHDKQQFNRFSRLPNILYSDGNDWALFRKGDMEGKRVRLSGDASQDGADAVGKQDAAKLLPLLTRFLEWEPVIPQDSNGYIDIRAFAKQLAPLCKFLRDDVLEALDNETSQLKHVAQGWRDLLFPQADDAQFADAYAQTVTFALLLGRSLGAGKDGTGIKPEDARDALQAQHNLLSAALQALTDQQVREELRAGLDSLSRLIGAVAPEELSGETDPWLHFFEDFLTEYDPKLRKDAGVYYTPVEVVRAQVRLIDSLLSNRLGKPDGFADNGVKTMDPATGTGTYLLGIIEHSLARIAKKYGSGAAKGHAAQLRSNLYGFENMVGPFAVTELRVTKALQGYGDTPAGGAQIYLTDTLENPNGQPMQGHFEPALSLSRQHAAALEVKNAVNVLVCLGNPPYDRSPAADASGGWVRHGDKGVDDRPILQDFLEPAQLAGHGVHLKNLYNLYVYFWRWALWKVFEQVEENGPGIVSFISASSYLDGNAFAGMREHMRRTCDEVWILDLGGEGRGPRRSENIFNIQTPVAIAVAIRAARKTGDQPATVRYARLEGRRTEKLATLDTIGDFSEIDWQTCPVGWQSRFRPEGEGSYFDWPLLTDLMPWQHSGVQVKRTWPICANEETLRKRWTVLLASADRAALFHEDRDRKITSSYKVKLTEKFDPTPLSDLDKSTPVPPINRYAYRSFDRQYVIADGRIISFARPSLWNSFGEKQFYFSSLFSQPLSSGPAIVASETMPDLDYFRGSYGAKAVLPLYRDADGTQPNTVPGLLELMGSVYGKEVTPEDFAAYLYGIMAHPSYTEQYYEELETREVRVPLTKDTVLFESVRDVGAQLLWLHTYGQRYVPSGELKGQVPTGVAKNIVSIPQTEEGFPTSYCYDESTQTLHVGKGQFAPVAKAVYEFEVSGLKVVQSWLKYRMRDGAGKKPSPPLDEIRPAKWPVAFTTELLELLWVLDATVARFPEQAKFLEAVVAGECFTATELPKVPSGMRQAPKPSPAGSLLV